jgi:hydrogenase maturation protein HypF
VCALLDIKSYNTYEGECACALESVARKANAPYQLTPSFNPIEILNEIKSLKGKVPTENLALGFHQMICNLILKTALDERENYDVEQIALSGGVFNNKIITANSITALEKYGFKVYINEKVPCGDGGIALGQAYIASLEE